MRIGKGFGAAAIRRMDQGELLHEMATGLHPSATRPVLTKKRQ
ncbi:hypothetical protein [Tateyamaria pelophila]|nr:hypothetical protein [Tateyamaria pelophila]